MINRRVQWVLLGAIALLLAGWWLRPSRETQQHHPPGGTNARGGAEISGPAPGTPAGAPALAGAGPSAPPPTGDRRLVWDLLIRHGVNPAALSQAHRAAWQSAEFRRLIFDNFTRTAYHGAVHDREQLHLELEYGVTNAAFFKELFDLDVQDTPPAERPESLVTTPESAELHDYVRWSQAESPGMKAVAEILHAHGIDAFPLILRASEDVGLLEFSQLQHSLIEKRLLQRPQEPSGPDPFRDIEEAEIEASAAGVEAFWQVVAAGFAQMSGIDDPELYRQLRAAGIQQAISPIRPPPGGSKALRERE